jgi:sulfate/thiosulfate transport system substrate-binding protein
MHLTRIRGIVAFAISLLSATILGTAHAGQTLLNVSYDPTRELYEAYNQAFASYWQSTTHQSVTINQSNGASGKQARGVIDGSGADVVTLALSYDIDAIQKAGLIQPGWQSRLPYDSSPYTSTIVFLVRRGNPKGIHDWSDLVRPGVQIVTSNPKSSGGARWTFLAAYGYALKANHGNQAAAFAYVQQLYKNVPVLPPGARGATIAFVQQHVGDVLLAWENEALLVQNKLGHGQYQIIDPSISILAEPPVAIVDKNVDAHGTRAVATAYLKYLYSSAGQTIAANNYYRPRLASAALGHGAEFPNIRLFDISYFGGWDHAQQVFFADGGVFDKIYGH